MLRAIPALAALPLASCKDKAAAPAWPGEAGGEKKPVVVYCSADAVYARPILERFSEKTGIEVKPLFDTEATKTTGLVQRLIDEKGSPACDVWWSSEPFGTIRLVHEGVLEYYDSDRAKEQAARVGLEEWPLTLRGRGQGGWYGFATRARVFVVNTRYVETPQRPACLADLCRPVFKGRVGIARPQFGTTRGHMGAVLVEYGEEGLRAWLEALKANDVRLMDGNAAVVRAVGSGELHVGLTDTDDVYAGQREGWDVDPVFEGTARTTFADTPKIATARGMGVMKVPNTVAVVKRHAHRNTEAAHKLVDYLLSPEAQLMLAKSDSRNAPVCVPKEDMLEAGVDPAQFQIPSPAGLNLREVADAVPAAMRVVDEVLGSV